MLKLKTNYRTPPIPIILRRTQIKRVQITQKAQTKLLLKGAQSMDRAGGTKQ